MTISVVIPVYNERESVQPLFDELEGVLRGIGKSYEIIFVDDGSTDGTLEVLKELPNVGVVSFARNSGKSKALEAGFTESRGDVVLTLDGDLQDDPKEIPRFLAEIEKGSALVVGWKQKRLDPFEKRFFSKIANAAARTLAGSIVHDMNCGFKAFRGSVARELRLYGDMHRYIPAIVANSGLSVSEIPVHHRERKFGHSKYGFSRLLSGFFDLVTLLFMRRFFDRPMHFFGVAGVTVGGGGVSILLYMSYLRVFLGQTIGNRPLLFLGILFVVVGFQLLSLGLLGELIIRQGKGSTPPLKFKKSAE
ncbi:hypothetical protein A2841_01520 [Candidatus Kaiserbacteria bacterium RIFCSPHIGHO2_01_FULL_48_10]|uniref:Glycosyltransferase 2-like domain-containing protein n=1 Tax=Candidatus Kaiserbacteria bacterium RIFCSPHIGHO2_01_FULL_48_10 TaxID=1798476 RepID=A0A1F6C1K1_9BACT|nr:MAG: hypothetical protein A2841_01520 [Candidatus Kaiserbacteria bacterium RIFCSPHIGHO2_01_FULL_48_10]